MTSDRAVFTDEDEIPEPEHETEEPFLAGDSEKFSAEEETDAGEDEIVSSFSEIRSELESEEKIGEISEDDSKTEEPEHSLAGIASLAEKGMQACTSADPAPSQSETISDLHRRFEAIHEEAEALAEKNGVGSDYPPIPNDIASLILVGGLSPGDILEAEYKNSKYTATVAPQGSIIYKDAICHTPSRAFQAATRKQGNGWDKWRLKSTGETLSEIFRRVASAYDEKVNGKK